MFRCIPDPLYNGAKFVAPQCVILAYHPNNGLRKKKKTNWPHN